MQCAVCDSAINNRASPPAQTILLIAGSHSLTVGRWNDHKCNESHTKLLQILKRTRLEEKLADGSITRFEQGELNQYKKKQRNIMFLLVKPRQPLANAEISSETNNSGSTAVVAIAAAPAAHCLVIPHAPNAASITTIPAILNSCEGIIQGYKKDTMVQDKIDKYIQFCAISGEEYVGDLEWIIK